MARIPLQVADRRLDTGNIVQYPSSTPVADAVQRLGGSIQGIAARIQERQDQKDTFDTRVKEQEFSARMSGLEQEAEQHANADGAGLHDSVYGQIGPDGRAMKPGSFDALFEEYAQKIPESKRAEFRAKKEAFRLQGSNRLARSQYAQEQAYYKVEIAKTQDQITTAMAESDPNDAQTFEAFKKQGLEIIDKSGLPDLEKEVARVNWLANADETLFKTKLAKNPDFAKQARAALGLAPANTQPGSGSVVDRIIGVESEGSATAKNPNSSATGAGQFISSTWLATVRKHAPQLMRGRSEAEVLALRNDRTVARAMTEALASDNADAMRAAGVPVNDGSIYLAHFAGVQGAITLLRAAPDASAESILGSAVVAANPFLKGKTASQVVAWAANKMNSAVPRQGADPAFANIPLDRRLVLANQADVQVADAERAAIATAKADYTQHKDALELSIVQGGIMDEGLIANDRILTDGDKATLIKAFRTQNDTALQTRTDLAALSSNSLFLDPYSSKDKQRADNLYTDAMKNMSVDQAGAIASAILEQTGVVPQPVVNAIRQGLTSTNVQQVMTAAQTAQRIAQVNPAALGRRDGGGEAQTAADDFAFMVNRLNLSPEDAAKRLIENRDPEKQRDRKALEPAAKAFLKELDDFNIAGQFDDSFLGVASNPDVGFNEQQRLGIQADFLAIAEDQFYRANGDPEIAKNRAVEQMKRLYGVTDVTGRKVLMKHPPEHYWPASRQGTSGFLGFGLGGAGWDYARQQLEADIEEMSPEADMGSVQLVTTPETDAMVKRGEMPGYAVLYKDKDGLIQTIPGKLWRPDFAAPAQFDQQQQQDAVEGAREQQTQERTIAPYQSRTTIDYMSGNDPVFGSRDGVVTAPIKQDTVESRVDERRQAIDEQRRELMQNGGIATGRYHLPQFDLGITRKR